MVEAGEREEEEEELLVSLLCVVLVHLVALKRRKGRRRWGELLAKLTGWLCLCMGWMGGHEEL